MTNKMIPTKTTTTTTTITCLLLLPLCILSFFFSSNFQGNKFNPPTPSSLVSSKSSTNSAVFKLTEEDNERSRISRLNKIENGLAQARAAIRKAAKTRKYTSISVEEGRFIPKGPIYRNPCVFHQSHLEMEKRFKIWIYKEGELPLVHQGPMKNIYGVEGQFIDEMESEDNKFVTNNPNEAHAYFLPFSVAKMVSIIYDPATNYDLSPFKRLVNDYVTMAMHKYPYWNKTFGADHFMVSCHDWGSHVSLDQSLYKNLIRALCNANISEGFRPRRDVAIPEVNVPASQLEMPNLGLPIKERSIFAFFAGGNHGHMRKFLFENWNKKDEEIQLNEYLSKDQNYSQLLGKSKFCLCPSGYEVASPRIVEAIHAECVPVIIKDDYSFPFSDVLDWSQFSVYVPKARIPELKTILKGISETEYMNLAEGVRSVKWHFTINRPAKPFDLLHMILHSIWLRRLNIRMPS